MEKQKRDSDIVENHIKKVVKPIFDKVLQETPINQTLVGKIDISNIEKRAWQPHNYRLYFDFNKENFNPPNQPTTNPPKIDQGWLSLVKYSYKPVNYGKEHLFMNFHWCNILVKKNQVSVTHKFYGKQWFLVSYLNPGQYEDFVNQKKKEMQDHCILALRKFIEVFGGSSDFKIIKEQKNDNSFAGDKVIDNLPEHLRVNTELFKKDYAEKLEFKGTEPMVNYVYNQSLKKKEPDILDELSIIKEIVKGTLEVNADTSKMINNMVRESMPALAEFHSDVRVHNKVLKGIEKNQKEENKLLSGIKKAFRTFNATLSQRKITEW